MNNKKYGPNVTKLIKLFIPKNAIPEGGGIADGLRFFGDPIYREKVIQASEQDAMKYINMMMHAPDNKYGKDIELIAKALLDGIEHREELEKLSKALLRVINYE